ncbi:HNH endonuclease [Alloiococcus sp. CFN-8]|uniref:HNH endonuclease n=1 Tax=Alloiococcus sp. CFN-8 TaxID=3416081 RepID=UPI003CEAC30A
MNMYVGITEEAWYEALKDEDYKEICFLKPAGNINFGALRRDELFLFKLHSPKNYIVGGGYFLHFSTIPGFTLWSIFKERSGAASFKELEERLVDPIKTGCIVLGDPFFFEEKDWIPIPEDWNSNIGHGKIYNVHKDIGRELYREVDERLKSYKPPEEAEKISEGFQIIKDPTHPFGEGAFKLKTFEAYHRTCAITGYRVSIALEASYIRPIEYGGTNSTDNGIILRSDLQKLFSAGYLSITDDYSIIISSQLKRDFNSGTAYNKYHGRSLKVLPDIFFERPSKENLKWHRVNVFLP